MRNINFDYISPPPFVPSHQGRGILNPLPSWERVGRGGLGRIGTLPVIRLDRQDAGPTVGGREGREVFDIH